MSEWITKLKAAQPETLPDIINCFSILLDEIRPSSLSAYQQAELKISQLIQSLQEDEDFRNKISNWLSDLIEQSDFTGLFVTEGISADDTFFGELSRKIKHKILPPVEDENSMQHILGTVFRKKDDFRWVDSVQDELWIKLFSLLHVQRNPVYSKLQPQVLNAILYLSYRIGYLGTDRAIHRMVSGEEALLTPFLEQNRELVDYVARFRENQHLEIDFRHVKVLLNQCVEAIKVLTTESQTKGTSLRQNFVIRQLESQVQRLLVLLDFIDNDHKIELPRLLRFLRNSVRMRNTRNSIRRFVYDNISLLSFQIVDHKSRTGEHYITSTRSEYFDFFYSSLKGGSIVGAMVLFKILLHKLHLPLFWEAFSYSILYAAGFVVIQVTGATLATKQPAMTASTIAASMDQEDSTHSSLAEMISRVWRSQFISFVGNLLASFPMAMLFAAAYQIIFGVPVTDVEGSRELLSGVNPVESLCLWYACITGFFLFISGVFSGWVDNKMVFSGIPLRILNHPLLKKRAGSKRFQKFVQYIEHNGGTLAGNIVLGFLLGTAGFIGKITALPYDIRHITFSAGNVAVGFFNQNFEVSSGYLIQCLIGVIGIGFFNFIISFSLALTIAIRSRRIDMSKYFSLRKVVWTYFRKKPFSFFWPEGEEKQQT